MVFMQAETGDNMESEFIKIEAEKILCVYEICKRKSTTQIAYSLRVSETKIRNIINELWLELLLCGCLYTFDETFYLNDGQIEQIVQYIKRDIHG